MARNEIEEALRLGLLKEAEQKFARYRRENPPKKKQGSAFPVSPSRSQAAIICSSSGITQTSIPHSRFSPIIFS